MDKVDALKLPLWSPLSWMGQAICQLPDYDSVELAQVISHLSSAAPLINFSAIESLQQSLSRVAAGQAFILQIGDCAERFIDATPDITQLKIKFIQDCAAVLTEKYQQPIVTIGRLAGQYAKPRSRIVEQVGHREMMAYRGDMINAAEACIHSRQPKALRMKSAYEAAHAVLSALRQQDPSIFVSHEALNLYYEQALTRLHHDNYFASSAHFLWVGARTLFPGSAHVEFIRGLHNPIGLKIEASMSPAVVHDIVLNLNPEKIQGKVTLIHRFGSEAIKHHLPAFIHYFAKKKTNVLWVCDPMHGNTRKYKQGIKTRYVDDILQELQLAKHIHEACDSRLSGIHLEATYETVNECIDNALHQADIPYQTSLVDPRLNPIQTTRVIKQF